MVLSYDLLMPAVKRLVETRQNWMYWQQKAEKSGDTYDKGRWFEEAGRYDGLLEAISSVTQENSAEWDARCQSTVEQITEKTDRYADDLLNSFGYV
ncbi:hypothetical protein AB0C33_01950 [Nonomuraea sp. NPDC048881]|uniref:hypothetical protein n=1 Tax=Nonomuraea sp. NPDC048881 TaxID=3155030 RepID=UPI0033F7F160